MEPGQILLIALGVVLVATNFIDFSKIKSWFAQRQVKKVEPKVSVSTDEVAISDIVAVWEHLRAMCEEKGLSNSVKELDEVFPTFLTVAKEEMDKSDES